VVTGGDPAGIGPEIFASSLSEIASYRRGIIYISTGAKAYNVQLHDAAKKQGIESRIEDEANLLKSDVRLPGEGLIIVELEEKQAIFPGKPSVESGRLALHAIELACDLIQKQPIRGLVTLPISKDHASKHAPNFKGHTDYLAERFECEVIMLMHGRKLSVIPLTVHIPIKDVSRRLREVLDGPKISGLLRILAAWKEMSGRWALCGLNPHAGENGLLGTEELDFLNDAADRFRNDGLPLDGPMAADGIFQEFNTGRYRLVLSCYHDQGLIPFKALEGRSGVNCTVGLPFPRTSPDHGTAFDLAGKGIADRSSFLRAFELIAEEGSLWI